LFGHLRHFVASAVASESVDTRDWMRPERPASLLRSVVSVLGGDRDASTLAEALGRPVVLDFVADTGDDRDLSVAVATMVAGTYRVACEDGSLVELPRGDILLFGGDTAYPVATADEIFRRLTAPWNEVLASVSEATGDTRRRVLLGVPGNPDWYDGIDGFARLFRKSAVPVSLEQLERDVRLLLETNAKSSRLRRKAGLLAKQLHLDEVDESLGLAANAVRSLRAFFVGDAVKRRKRLVLEGYDAVQECSYWALPLAPGLDAWGLDRQLRRVDFRQRAFFARRRLEAPDGRLLFCASDPALAFGERSAKGAEMLEACALSLERDPVFYLTGDIHHYERRSIGRAMHVIAGGGGAFLHGTRITPSPSGPADCAYPTPAMSRRLVVPVPIRMMLGRAGFLPHMLFAALGWMQLAAAREGSVVSGVVAGLLTLAFIVGFYFNAGHHKQHPRLVLGVAIPFGIVLGLGPTALRTLVPESVFAFADVGLVLAYAFIAALVFGLFLTTCAVLGIEHEQAFAALGHPGFKHFVRLRIALDGTIEGFVIGKDDPLSNEPPVLVDRFVWSDDRPDRKDDAPSSSAMPSVLPTGAASGQTSLAPPVTPGGTTVGT
jgi:hypothetical protein